MPSFLVRAVNPDGARVRAVEEAGSSNELVRTLEQRGLLIIDVKETEDAAGRGTRSAVSRRGVLEATRALASLLSAGLPLSRALAVSGQLTRGSMPAALGAVRQRVEQGDALHAALADQPALFDPLYRGVVRAGERSGDLAAAFRRLEAQLEREQALRSKLVSASIYPLVLAVVGGGAVVLLLLLVLPRFADLLVDSGATLPTSTAVMLGVSRLAQHFWPILAFGPPLMVAAVVAYGRTRAGRRVLARSALALPGIGSLRRQALAGRFARLMGVLTGGGAPLLAALEDMGDSLGDPVAADEAARVRMRVREGASLNIALSEGQVFPALLAQLVALGEEAGRLEEFLAKAADLFEERVERSVERLVALAEPTMIVVFGGLVGLVALSLLQAIYGVNAGSFR